jgi:hypothetical protein
VCSAMLGMMAACLAAPAASLRPGEQDKTVSRNPAPSADQLQSLISRIIENQHRNDRALEEFERVERVISRKDSPTSPIVTDRTNRIIPSGTGITRFEIALNGAPISKEAYRRNLQIAIDALELALHPSERERQDLAKFEKRRRDRADIVDTAMKAFRFSWAGRETLGSQTFAKILLDPDPNFKPATRLAAVFEHVNVVMWVDESQAQVARIEADITSEITFGGGIFGKVNRGGHFVMEQSEIEPGIWLPKVSVYDLDGRKFLFGFGLHEKTEITQYRRLGPPAQAVEMIREELRNLSAEHR